MCRLPIGRKEHGRRSAIWKDMFPLELTAEPEEADIRFNWDSDMTIEGAAGEELDWVQIPPRRKRADGPQGGSTLT